MRPDTLTRVYQREDNVSGELSDYGKHVAEQVKGMVQERKQANESIRALIRKALIRLTEDIRELHPNEKTIGTLSRGDIGEVLVALHKMYLSPDGYNIAVLGSHIDKMEEVYTK